MSLLGSEINDLKGVFNKRQGPAKTNRFMVYMSPPNSSLLNLDVGSVITGVLGGGGINLGGMVNDPRDISLLCESCSLPGRSITTMDYQNVKHSVKIPYSFINEDVTFTFILTGDYYIKKMFDAWMGLTFDTQNYVLQYKEKYTADVRIAQVNSDNIPIYTIVLQRAYPTAIQAITLDNTSENTIQKVTVTMTYENFVQEGLIASAANVVSGVLGSAGSAIGAISSAVKKYF